MADTPPKNLTELKVAELKVELEKRGLQTSGVKAVLIERLKAALQEEGTSTEDVEGNEEVRNEEINEQNNEENDVDGDEGQGPGEEQPEEVSGEGQQDYIEETENVDEMQDESDFVNANLNGEEGNEVIDEVHENGNTDGVPDGTEDNEDSLNIMIGDEDNLFGDENENKESLNGGVIHASPPRPDSIPAKHPFTSKDTINLSSRGGKAPSDNSSMLVNPADECSVASHDSGEAKEGEEKPAATNTEAKEQNGGEGEKTKKEETEEDKKKSTSHSSRNLWISGLSSTTRATDLKAVFSKHGKVIGAKVVTNARTPGARCYGYVTMNSTEDAVKCIQSLNKTELHGRMITVERAKEPSSSTKTEDKKKDQEKKDEKKDDGKKDGGTSTHKDDKDKKSVSRNRITAPEGSASGSSRRDDDRRSGSSRAPAPPSSHHPHSSHGPPRRDDRRPQGQGKGPGVLTFHQIKDQRRRELEREEERRHRERERRRREDEDRRRRQRDEEERLRRERDDLRRERERLEREKQGMGSICIFDTYYLKILEYFTFTRGSSQLESKILISSISNMSIYNIYYQ